MKILLSIFIAVLSISCAICQTGAENKRPAVGYWPKTDKAQNRAQKGEKVFVIVVKVKNDSKKRF